MFLVNQDYENDDNLAQYNFICTFSLSRFLSNKLSLVRKVSTMFTLTLIQAGDGETDPRNLLILFSAKLSILTSLDVRHHTEEIYEVGSLHPEIITLSIMFRAWLATSLLTSRPPPEWWPV